jgi:hypothetical protein
MATPSGSSRRRHKSTRLSRPSTRSIGTKTGIPSVAAANGLVATARWSCVQAKRIDWFTSTHTHRKIANLIYLMYLQFIPILATFYKWAIRLSRLSSLVLRLDFLSVLIFGYYYLHFMHVFAKENIHDNWILNNNYAPFYIMWNYHIIAFSILYNVKFWCKVDLHLKFIFLQISHFKNEIKMPIKCLTILNFIYESQGNGMECRNCRLPLLPRDVLHKYGEYLKCVNLQLKITHTYGRKASA